VENNNKQTNKQTNNPGSIHLPFGVVFRSRLLGLRGDFNGKLDGLLQGIAGLRIDWLHRLNINVGDDEVVLGEDETVVDDFTSFSKNGLT
jgi:hypothetical protein